MSALRGFAWAPFAPALCVVLLMAHFYGATPGKDAGYLAVSGGSNVLASLSANLINFCATNTRAERLNIWAMPAAKATFDWTNAGHSVTTTDYFPSWKTNIEKL
jgi:hypothetical protein